MYWHAGDTTVSLQRKMHKHSPSQHNRRDLIAIHTAIIVVEIKLHAYPYCCHTTDKDLFTLGDEYFTKVFTWDSQETTNVATKNPPSGPLCIYPRITTTNSKSSRVMTTVPGAR